MSDFISGIFNRHKNDPTTPTEEESTDTSAPVFGDGVATTEATSEVATETDVYGAETVAQESTEEVADVTADVTADVATEAATEVPAVDPLSDPAHVITDSEATPAADVAELAENETVVGSEVVGEVAETAPVETSVDQVETDQVETEDAFGTPEGEVIPAVDAETDAVGVDAAAVAEGETIFSAGETEAVAAAPEGLDETEGAYDAAPEGTESVEAAVDGDVVSGDVGEDASVDVEDTVAAVEPVISDVDATDSDVVESDVEGTLPEETNVSEFGGATDTVEGEAVTESPVEGEDVVDEVTDEVAEPAAEVESGDESPFATEAVVDEPAAEDSVITDAEDVETADETVVESAVETPEADVAASTEAPVDDALEVAGDEVAEDTEAPVEAAYVPAEAEVAEDTEVVEAAPVEEPVASVESAEAVATEDTADLGDEASAEDTIAEDVLVDEAPVAEKTPVLTDSQVEDVETSDELVADAEAEAATDEAATDEAVTDEAATDEVAVDEVTTEPVAAEEPAPGFAPEPIVEQEPVANDTLTGVLRVARESRGKSTVSEGLVERLVHHVVAKVDGVHAIDDEGTSVDIVGEIANITVSYVIAFGNPVKATAATIRTNVIEVVEDYFDIDVEAVDVNVSDFHDA